MYHSKYTTNFHVTHLTYVLAVTRERRRETYELRRMIAPYLIPLVPGVLLSRSPAHAVSSCAHTPPTPPSTTPSRSLLSHPTLIVACVFL